MLFDSLGISECHNTLFLSSHHFWFNIKPPSPHPESITDRSKAVLLLWFLNVTCCCVFVHMVFSNMIIWITAAHYVSCSVLVLLLFSIRVAERPPVWGWTVHSVYCSCLLWTFVSLCLCSIPFWFWGWGVGFDYINSWSLHLYLLYTVCHYPDHRTVDINGFTIYWRCSICQILTKNGWSASVSTHSHFAYLLHKIWCWYIYDVMMYTCVSFYPDFQAM